MKVLILDDEAPVRDFFKSFLESSFDNCECFTCGSVQEFKKLNTEINPDFYILDVVLLNGQVFSAVDQFDPSRAILITGYDSNRVRKVAQMYGFHGVLPKPVNGDVLKSMLDSLILRAGSQSRSRVQSLMSVFPRLFGTLAKSLVNGQKVQDCVEIVGKALDATVIVSPFEQDGTISFPLFAYFKEGEPETPRRLKLPQSWLDQLLDGELVTHFGQELSELGTAVRRALALPIKGEGIGQWGFFLTFDGKATPYTQEEITFVRCVVDILALALLRLRHNTTLETVLRNAITKSKCLLK